MRKLLGLFIKERRLELNMSGRQLARESGISSGYLSQIELGQFIPKPAVLLKLAKPLCIDYELLLIKAGVLPETLAETDHEYRTAPTTGGITIAGPRLTLPILGTVPAAGSFKTSDKSLGSVPYIDAADFAVKVSDNSLENANILPGDVIYISKQSRAKTDDLTLVEIDGQILLRFITKSDKTGVFKAANASIADITSDNYDIIGVRVAVLRQ